MIVHSHTHSSVGSISLGLCLLVMLAGGGGCLRAHPKPTMMAVEPANTPAATAVAREFDGEIFCRVPGVEGPGEHTTPGFMAHLKYELNCRSMDGDIGQMKVVSSSDLPNAPMTVREVVALPDSPVPGEERPGAFFHHYIRFWEEVELQILSSYSTRSSVECPEGYAHFTYQISATAVVYAVEERDDQLYRFDCDAAGTAGWIASSVRHRGTFTNRFYGKSVRIKLPSLCKNCIPIPSNAKPSTWYAASMLKSELVHGERADWQPSIT